MDFFSQYIQPLTSWFYTHPHAALFVTFIISMGESLAIIGTLIPGTVSMTAIGILAGSGIMRIDLTLLAAILGAIAGDGLSYTMGRYFSERLNDMWVFRRYPNWLSYGKNYFLHHGAKSVFIGRFTGPLRSLIPIVSGMMGMNRWYFFLANVTSAIIWSCLYVIPGILIGSASVELSPKSSSKLFVVILLLLAISWVMSVLLKWFFVRIHHWLRRALNTTWSSGLNHPFLGHFVRFITPVSETNDYTTARFFLILLLCGCLLPTLVLMSQHTEWVNGFNQSVYQFCLSIRTNAFDAFFIMFRLALSYYSLLSFTLAIFFYTLYQRNGRLLLFWASLNLTTLLLVFILPLWMSPPINNVHLFDVEGLLFPLTGLVVATALFSFVMLYVAGQYKHTTALVLNITLAILLLFSGLAIIYLSENFIMNVIVVYLVGFTNALAHWILYRRRTELPPLQTTIPITLAIVLLLLTTGISAVFLLNKIAGNQQPYTQQFMVQHDAWWNQNRPLLPLYSTNRFGKKMSFLNIQYVGSIEHLQQTLTDAGWQKQNDSLLHSLLFRIIKQDSIVTLPLMAQLYLYKKPKLIMTYGSPIDDKSVIFRLWRSNYHIHNQQQIIWIGSIQAQTKIGAHLPPYVFNSLPHVLSKYATKKIKIYQKMAVKPNIIWLVEENS